MTQSEPPSPEASPETLRAPIPEVRKTWDRHFERPFTDHRPWRRPLNHNTAQDAHRFGQLFADCFGHQNDARHAPDDESAIHFQDDPRRLVRKDNLSAYFQQQYDEGAPGYTQIPIYESPDEVDDLAELGPAVVFDRLYSCVTAIPFNPSDTSSSTLGENRMTFIVGPVGVGKTLTISRVVRRIARKRVDRDGFVVLPAYLSIEDFLLDHPGELRPHELLRRFLLRFHSRIAEAVTLYAPTFASKLKDFQPDTRASAGVITTAIAALIRALARNASEPTRVVAFLDNIDPLHYFGSRYLFFPSLYTDYRRGIEEKIEAIVFQFIGRGSLGEAGLCVCVAARTHVARDSRLINSPAQPRRSQVMDDLVFQLGPVDPREVVASRLRLMDAVAAKYSESSERTRDGLDLREQVRLVEVAMGRSLAPENFGDGLRRVSRLAHHGSRSLVEFLGRLRIDPLGQGDATDRLFGSSPWLLERLYIANAFSRYTQDQDHFPNIFLVDGMISEKVVRPVLHRQTYWLKYLLLQRIARGPRSGLPFEDLAAEFVDGYGFEDKIVRLTVGSLATVNTFGCVEIAGVLDDDCHRNRLRATSRGMLLVGAHPEYRFPYCFELSYLQMVIDDYLLSLPKDCASRIAIESTLSHALDRRSDYASRMIRDLQRKIPATLTFVRVLEAAWAEECRVHDGLVTGTAGVAPDFDRIYGHLSDTIRAIADQARFGAGQLLEEIRVLRLDDSFDRAVRSYSEDHVAAVDSI